MDLVSIIIGASAGFIIGGILSYYIWDKALKKKKDKIITEAQNEGEVIKKDKILQAKEKFLQLKGEHEKFIQEKNSKISVLENKLHARETNINQRRDELQKKVKEFEITRRDVDVLRENLNSQLQRVELKSEELDKIHRMNLEKLEQLSGLSADEAKAQLVETLKDEAQSEAAAYISEI